MMTSILLLSIMTMFSLEKSENPLKMSIKLMLLTISLFTYMSMATGSSWFSFILTMLMLGGILIIFTILSSLMPNEKLKKEKKTKLMMMVILAMTLTSSPMKMSNMNLYKENKTFTEETPIFIMIMSLMLFYFISFIFIISKKDMPMRKLDCFKKSNFVNFSS